MNNNIIMYFKENGMINPKRSINLICKAIKFTKLDLNGLIVLLRLHVGSLYIRL